MEFILKNRIVILIVGICLTLIIGYNARYLKIDGSFTTVLPKNDPDFLYNKYVEETFGNSDEIIIFIRDEKSIYRMETLLLIDNMSQDLAQLKLVSTDYVFNLIKAADFDLLSLKDQNKNQNDLLKDLKIFMETDPLFSEIIVNREGTGTLIIAPISGEVSLSESKLKNLSKDVKKITDKYRKQDGSLEIIETGHPLVNAEIMEKMANDLFLLFPMAILTVALMLFAILKSIKGMLIPILITVFAVAWTFGLKGFLRSPLTITETVIPVILISVACADGIHIVSESFHYMHEGYSSRKAITLSMKKLWKPVVLTSLTTSIGFASFVFSKGESLRNMGLFLSFGVLTAMLFSLVYIPVLISWFKPVKGNFNKVQYKKQVHLLRHIERFTELILRKRPMVLILTALILIISLWGIFHINTDTDEIRYFKKDNIVRQSAEIIENEMGGISLLQIVLESKENNIFQDLEILNNIEKLQRILEEDEAVSYTLSISDYVSYFYYRIKGNRKENFKIPENQLFLFRLFKLMNNKNDPRSEAIQSFVDKEYRKTKITVRLKESNTKVMENLIENIQDDLKILFDDRITINYAGDYLRLSNGRIIVESQVYSLSMTLAIILLVLSILYKSLRMGFIVSLPVMIAVLFNFAIMWVFRVSLNPATSIIAAVGLGVGIDYSIHLYSRFQYLYIKSGRQKESIINAVVETSRGILSNALSVGMGFLILLFSAYRIINDMGWIVALSMATTSLTSLILLPVLLSMVKNYPFTNKSE